MSFFRRNTDKPLIPPVESERGPATISNSTSPRPPIRSSNARSYNASRDGDPYNTQQNDAYAVRDKYSRSNGVGDVYSRGAANIEQDRNELFSGYNPQKSGSGRFFDGPLRDGEGDEDDVEGIKQQTKFMKQESVNSTRNALRMAREAEETARGTLGKLGEQSERLANTERHLDISKGHSQRANDRTDELKQLNRSIFRPVIVFNKDAKRTAHDAKIQERYEEERQEREKVMMGMRETQDRLGRAQTYGRQDDDEEGQGSSRFRSATSQVARKEQRKRYQFEGTASDDELEDELDDNLNEISEATKRLRALGMAMGQELDTQIKNIETIDGKAVGLDNRLFQNTERLKKIK